MTALAVSLRSADDGKDLYILPLVFAGTIVTHLVYGIYFIEGLLARELER